MSVLPLQICNKYGDNHNSHACFVRYVLVADLQWEDRHHYLIEAYQVLAQVTGVSSLHKLLQLTCDSMLYC